MKRGPLLCLIIFTSFAFQSAVAQQVDHIQRGQRGYSPPMLFNQSTFIELVDPHEEVERILPKCVVELNLDDFEKEIVKNILLKKFENQNAILEDEANTRETRKKKIADLEKAFFIDLGSILSPEKVEKFGQLDFTKTKKDKKRKKKRNKN